MLRRNVFAIIRYPRLPVCNRPARLAAKCWVLGAELGCQSEGLHSRFVVPSTTSGVTSKLHDHLRPHGTMDKMDEHAPQQGSTRHFRQLPHPAHQIQNLALPSMLPGSTNWRSQGIASFNSGWTLGSSPTLRSVSAHSESNLINLC